MWVVFLCRNAHAQACMHAYLFLGTGGSVSVRMYMGMCREASESMHACFFVLASLYVHTRASCRQRGVVRSCAHARAPAFPFLQ